MLRHNYMRRSTDRPETTEEAHARTMRIWIAQWCGSGHPLPAPPVTWIAGYFACDCCKSLIPSPGT